MVANQCQCAQRASVPWQSQWNQRIDIFDRRELSNNRYVLEETLKWSTMPIIIGWVTAIGHFLSNTHTHTNSLAPHINLQAYRSDAE